MTKHKKVPVIDLSALKQNSTDSDMLSFLPLKLKCLRLNGTSPELINRLIQEHMRQQTDLGFPHPHHMVLECKVMKQGIISCTSGWM
ncbi:unnamed protein product [Prunus armeniaca]|uniref:Uncharacterized protein n=1 Tax=Prunus armeniaca TaxID=36596 RepID=A0A6J5UB59_PRUAR|nr:unnamed protein product [Prunus armeniaca]